MMRWLTFGANDPVMCDISVKLVAISAIDYLAATTPSAHCSIMRWLTFGANDPAMCEHFR